MFDLLTTNNEAIVKAAQRYLSYLCLTIILTWILTSEDRFKAVKLRRQFGLLPRRKPVCYPHSDEIRLTQARMPRLPSDTG